MNVSYSWWDCTSNNLTFSFVSIKFYHRICRYFYYVIIPSLVLAKTLQLWSCVATENIIRQTLRIIGPKIETSQQVGRGAGWGPVQPTNNSLRPGLHQLVKNYYLVSMVKEGLQLVEMVEIRGNRTTGARGHHKGRCNRGNKRDEMKRICNNNN